MMWLLLLCIIVGLNQSTAGWNDDIPYDWNQPDLKERLRGMEFRVYAYQFPPTLYNTEASSNGSSTWKGAGIEFVEYFAQHFDLRIVYVRENLSQVAEYGALDAGINALANNEADLLPRGIMPSPKRLERIDMCDPFFSSNFQMLVRWPEKENGLTALTKPYSLTAWVAISASILAVVGTLVLLDRMANPHHWYQHSLMAAVGSKFLYALGIIAGQGSHIPCLTRCPFRLMLGLWLLMMVVLINAYTGTLISYLTVPKLEAIPNSLEELAASRRYKISIEQGTLLSGLILSATNGALKVLGDFLRNHPNQFFQRYDQVLDNVLYRHCASIQSDIAIKYRIGSDLKATGTCRLVASKPLDYKLLSGFALPKNSPFTRLITYETRQGMERGLGTYWLNQNYLTVDKCSLANAEKSEKMRLKPIKLLELSSPFLLLAMGYALSIVAYLFEFTIGFALTRRQ